LPPDRTVVDQGEWERCASARRMYLALRETKKDPLPVAEQLLRLAEKHRPDSCETRLAQEYWERGLHEERRPEKESADRVYLVIHYVAKAFDEQVFPIIAGGGEALACTVIRRQYPLAPKAFRKVGRMSGETPAGDPISERCWPNKIHCKVELDHLVATLLEFLLGKKRAVA